MKKTVWLVGRAVIALVAVVWVRCAQADTVWFSASAVLDSQEGGKWASDEDNGIDEARAIVDYDLDTGASASAVRGILRATARSRSCTPRTETRTKATSLLTDAGTVVDGTGLSRPLPSHVFIHVGLQGNCPLFLAEDSAGFADEYWGGGWGFFELRGTTAGIVHKMCGSSHVQGSPTMGNVLVYNAGITPSWDLHYGSYLTGYASPDEPWNMVGGELIFPVAIDPMTGRSDPFELSLIAEASAIATLGRSGISLACRTGADFHHTARITAVTLENGMPLDGFAFAFDSGYVPGPVPEPGALALLTGLPLTALLYHGSRRKRGGKKGGHA
ncbi:MAG: hypothetical protein JW809_17115 [Pirellulales bacterium]|nr:hypothetical protein [Pirellulales bacterium]